jgi:hypothetical protein
MDKDNVNVNKIECIKRRSIGAREIERRNRRRHLQKTVDKSKRKSKTGPDSLPMTKLSTVSFARCGSVAVQPQIAAF